jgi:LysM repeat protein
MLISPPFLDGTNADPFDETFVDKLMEGTGDGFFPLSARLGWHGGLHLKAPRDASGAALPVRAIADGTVMLVRKPEREPATPAEAVTKSKDENEPLAYDRGWTSNGAVVIKHSTDIGADGDTPVNVTFYSVYQHLHSIPTIAEGKPIWRKDIIGTAGYIAGQSDRIQFEIVMDKANVDKLIGSSGLIGPQNPVPPTTGRTDSVWGSTYFYVPDGVPVYGVDPRLQTQPYRVKTGDTPDSVATAFNTTVARLKTLNHHGKDSDEAFATWFKTKLPAPTPPPSTSNAHAAHAPHHSAPTPIVVPQRYGQAAAPATTTPPPSASTPASGDSTTPASTTPAPPAEPDPNPPLAPIGQSGTCRIAMKLFKTSTMTTTSPTGTAVGTPVTESAVSEYDLYTVANDLYPHCASAGHELLRFGRVIGPDALHPDDANPATHRHEHFREANVLMSDGTTKQGFIDLNASGVVVFSESDFSAYDSWVLIDDDSNGDARCDSPLVYGSIYAAYLGAHSGELANEAITAIKNG